MIKKITKFFGILLFSIFSFLPAGAISKDIPAYNMGINSSDYIYVSVYENGKWYIYVYESDGVTLVTVIEEEW